MRESTGQLITTSFYCGIFIYLTSVILNKLSLRGSVKIEDFNKIALPVEIDKKYSGVNIDRFSSYKERKELEIFCDVIKTKIKEENLGIFLNNINTLEIKHVDFSAVNFCLRSNTKGQYNTKNIILLDKDYYKTIFHELEHMASTITKDGVTYCGFMQIQKDFAIGSGLNEGYTQLETERNFSEYNPMKSYGSLVYICKILEIIIGEEKMKDYYYNANLYGLIDELKNYVMIDEIMMFINYLDYLKDVLYSKQLKKIDIVIVRDKILSALTYIDSFLLKTYSVKLNRQRLNGEINEEEFTNMLSEFVYKLPFSVKLNNKDYSFFDADKNEDILEEITDYLEYDEIVRKKI